MMLRCNQKSFIVFGKRRFPTVNYRCRAELKRLPECLELLLHVILRKESNVKSKVLKDESRLKLNVTMIFLLAYYFISFLPDFHNPSKKFIETFTIKNFTYSYFIWLDIFLYFCFFFYSLFFVIFLAINKKIFKVLKSIKLKTK